MHPRQHCTIPGFLLTTLYVFKCKAETYLSQLETAKDDWLKNMDPKPTGVNKGSFPLTSVGLGWDCKTTPVVKHILGIQSIKQNELI